jgi:hypothetical protein
MNITKEEVQELLDAFQSIADNEENPMDTREAISLLQSKLEKDDGEPVTAQAAAIRTLTFLGYTYHGAEQWKPPLGKTPEPVSDFDIRGKLSALKCWHRLSGDEIQDLIEFFGGSSAAPKPMTEPICGKNYAAGLWSRRNLEAYLEDQGC